MVAREPQRVAIAGQELPREPEVGWVQEDWERQPWDHSGAEVLTSLSLPLCTGLGLSAAWAPQPRTARRESQPAEHRTGLLSSGDRTAGSNRLAALNLVLLAAEQGLAVVRSAGRQKYR